MLILSAMILLFGEVSQLLYSLYSFHYTAGNAELQEIPGAPVLLPQSSLTEHWLQ